MAPKPQTSASSARRNPHHKPGQSGLKKPLPVSERLKRLFTSLCAQIDGGHFNNAIKTCDKILRLEPHDKDALQTKVFLLLQTEQYDTALSLISSDDAFASFAFEKAYSLYRLHRESEATEILNVLKEKGDDESLRGVFHLDAQLSYRQGDYQTTVELYNQLLDSAEPQTEEHSDILTNLEASQKHLDFITTDFLRALDALPSSSASMLESAPPPQAGSSLAATLASVAAAPEPPKQVKTVRMKRVPVGVVPGVTPPPDPERWLKKSERSTFGQGRRRKGGGGGATQGIVESAASTGNVQGHAGKGVPAHGKAKKKK